MQHRAYVPNNLLLSSLSEWGEDIFFAITLSIPLYIEWKCDIAQRLKKGNEGIEKKHRGKYA